MYSDPSVDYKLTQAMSDAYMEVLEGRLQGNERRQMQQTIRDAQAEARRNNPRRGGGQGNSGGATTNITRQSALTDRPGDKIRQHGSTPTKTEPTKPTTSTPTTTTASAPTPTAPKPKPSGTAMQQWAKANPKLASKVKPGQAGYNEINMKPTATAAATAKPATKTAFSSPSMMKTPKINTSAVKAPKPSGGTSRIDAATSNVGKWSEAYDQWIDEGYKKFPRGKVQDKAAMKPDTAKGESQARKMDRARVAHTHKDTKDDAKSAVKERELDNRKTGLEKTYKKSPSHKNKAYELEAQRRKDLDKKMDQKSKGHSKMEESFELYLEGKKDACYHKVKSRYDVWPSAYASGALVKCRRAGAKNWGNSSKKD